MDQERATNPRKSISGEPKADHEMCWLWLEHAIVNVHHPCYHCVTDRRCAPLMWLCVVCGISVVGVLDGSLLFLVLGCTYPAHSFPLSQSLCAHLITLPTRMRWLKIATK